MENTVLTIAELDRRPDLAAAGWDLEGVGDVDVVAGGAAVDAVGDVAEAERGGVVDGAVSVAARWRGRRRALEHEVVARQQAAQPIPSAHLGLRRRGDERRGGEDEEKSKLGRCHL